MKLERIVEEKVKSSLSDDYDMFERKAVQDKIVVKDKALKENLYTKEMITSLLYMYKKPHFYPNKNSIGSFKKLSSFGINSSHVKKIKTGATNRIYINEDGVRIILEHYYNKNCIEKYKKNDVVKDLRTIASRM